MKTLQEYLTESSHKFKTIEDVEKYLSKFPDTATSWRNATDEIRDIARISKEFINELDNANVDALDFHSLKTPADWNMTGKDYIRMNMSKMSKNTLRRFLDELSELF